MSDQTAPNRTSLTLVGIVSIILGVVAIAAPAVAGKWVVIIIGVVLLLGGVVQIVSGLRSEGWLHTFPPVILGVITTLAGIGVLGHPLLGLTFLTLLLVIFFILEGIWKIVASFSYRQASGWLALLMSGVLTLVFGILIWNQWPVSGLWAVGILVGVDLLTTGISLIAVASPLRRFKKTAQSTTAD